MIGPRWRKILRDVGSNKTRSSLVIASIAVGVFAVGMIVSSQIILTEDLSAQYLATKPASAVIYTSAFTGDDVLASVRGTPGVGDAEGRRRATVRVQVGPDEWKTLRLEAVDNFERLRLNQFQPEAGAWPPKTKEILIERASLPVARAAIGDTMTVETPDGRTRELKVVGSVHDLNKAPPVFTGTPFGYISFDTLEWLGFPRSMNEIGILVSERSDDKAHIKDVVDEVTTKLERGGLRVDRNFIPDPGKHPSDSVVQPMLLILGVLGTLSMGLSAFLVVNTISALMAQQTRQIGIMKTIGARRGQIVGMYLFAVLIFGVLSLLVAVPLGAIASFLFTSYMAGLLNFDVAFRVPPEAVALEVAIGLTIPLLAAIVPILNGVRITVREAISSAGGAYVGHGFIDRWLQQVRGLPRPQLLSLRNTFRRKARLGLTLFTLTLGGAIFIAVLTVHTSFLATLNQALDYWNYDVSVEFNRSYRSESIQAEALRVPGVVAAETWVGGVARRIRADGSESSAGLGTRQGPQGIESDNMRVLGLPPDTRVLAPQLTDGRWLVPGDTRAVVINTEVLKDEPDVVIGGPLRLKIRDKEEDFTVVGVVKSSLSGSWLYVDQAFLAELTNQVGRASSVQLVTDDHSLAAQLRMAGAVKDHFDSVGLTVASTSTLASIRAQSESQISILTSFLAVMAVILAVVGGIGLMGTMSINVLERSREIGVMRAIGAADRSVLTIFMFEGVLIGLISWVLGAILSFPISKLLSDAVGIAFVQAPLTYSFATAGAGLWLFLVIVLAMIASFWPSFRASRITVREVLAYE